MNTYPVREIFSFYLFEFRPTPWVVTCLNSMSRSVAQPIRRDTEERGGGTTNASVSFQLCIPTLLDDEIDHYPSLVLSCVNLEQAVPPRCGEAVLWAVCEITASLITDGSPSGGA